MNVAAVDEAVQDWGRYANAVCVQPLSVFASAELCQKFCQLAKERRFSSASPVNQRSAFDQVFFEELSNRA